MIHESLEQAKLAVEHYEKAIETLRRILGVYEECNDSCCDIYLKAKYRDKHNYVRTYSTI